MVPFCGGTRVSRVRLEAHSEMVGILVLGNNHFILSGPLPDEATALALARHWSLVQIGDEKLPALEPWQIRTKAFRENLEWAMVVPGDRETSPGFVKLLAELSARGVAIHRCSKGCWSAIGVSSFAGPVGARWRDILAAAMRRTATPG